MKVRKFYPRQLLRRLQGEHSSLGAGQRAALLFVIRRRRKLGYSVQAGPIANSADLLAAGSTGAAQTILANCNTRIILLPAI